MRVLGNAETPYIAQVVDGWFAMRILRNGVIRDMGDTGQQPSSTGLSMFADHACQDQAPDWGKSDPHPGVSIGFTLELGAGQMHFLGMHETPQLVELAFPHMQVVPQGKHNCAAVVRDTIEPGVDRVFVHLDNPPCGP